MINNMNRIIAVVTFFLFGFSAVAQEIIQETVVKSTDSVKTSSKRQKIDGIIATVGDFNILDSDIDKSFLELSSQGASIKDISRCQMLGKLLEDKLYAHQAIQDSVIVKDEEINEKMTQQLSYMVEQLGTMEKVIKYFKKSSEDDFRSELFELLKQQKLAAEMQRKIVDEIQITPEETRNFFKKIPDSEKPIFGAELEVANIVIVPKITQEEKQKVIDKLKLIKQEVLSGASFKTRAVIYSDDRGSASTGGFYKINRKTGFVKEFKDVAFSLKEGEISEPFETEFGYHIILVEKIKGQDLELRHILLMPKVSSEALAEAKEKIELIKKRVEAKEITFADAARSM